MNETAKDRPIIFSGPMVRAILAGRKTQTRRVVKPPPMCAVGWPVHYEDGENGIYLDRPNGGPYLHYKGSPFGVVGDRLWVRESVSVRWLRCGCYEQPCDCCNIETTYVGGVKRRFNDGDFGEWEPKDDVAEWKVSPIHLPRFMCRLTLEITGMRVERLQAITEDDAFAEGVDEISLADVPRQATLSRTADFAQLWDRINGNKHPWASNPWVWVLAFKPVTLTTSPEDAIGAA